MIVLAALAMLASASRASAWRASLHGAGPTMEDQWESVALLPSGDAIVTGLSYVSKYDLYHCDLIVARLAADDGAVVWRQDEVVIDDERPDACTLAVRVLVDAHGDFVIGHAGQVTKRSGATGEILWQKSVGTFPYDGPYDQATALAPDGDVLFGGGFGDDLDDASMVVGKLDGASGDLLWQRSFDGTAPGAHHDFAGAIAADHDGNVLVLGGLVNLVEDDFGSYAMEQPVALKLAGDDGDVLWTVDTESEISYDDRQTALVVDASGDVLQRGPGLSILKRSGTDGKLLWRYQSDAGSSPRSYGVQIALGAGGDVVATGEVLQNPPTIGASSVLVVRVNGATGAERWRTTIERAAELADAPRGLAIDAAGRVLVAVLSERKRARYDFLVVALDGADGSLDWQVDVDGPGLMKRTRTLFWNEFVGSLALDGTHVVAVGGLPTESGGADGVAVALDLDGKESWRQTLAQHFPGTDEGRALTVLPGGDVVATGATTSASREHELAVYRLGTDDGATIWSMTFGTGRGTTLISDQSGDVVLAGVLGPIEPDAATNSALVAKLDGKNGTERWRSTIDDAVVDDRFGNPLRVPLGTAPNGDVFVATTRRAKRGGLIGVVDRLAADDGSRIWRSAMHGRWVLDLVVDAHGDLLLRTSGPRELRTRITKLDGATGATLWNVGTGTSLFRGHLAATPAGDAIVGGTLARPAYGPVVLALDGATGTRRWRRVLSRGDGPARIATTPGGNVLVAIDLYGAPARERVLTLDGATGGTSWERTLDVAAPSDSCGSSALASDADDNMLLGTCLLPAGDEVRLELSMLSAHDGATQWTRRIAGSSSVFGFIDRPGDSIGVAEIASDALGNVVAVGTTADAAQSYELTVVKWSATDGSDDIAVVE